MFLKLDSVYRNSRRHKAVTRFNSYCYDHLMWLFKRSTSAFLANTLCITKLEHCLKARREMHLSFFHHRSGGRWEKLKSERSCAKLRFDFVLAVGKIGEEDGVTDTTWLKSLNFLQGGFIYLVFSAMVSNMGVGRERHIHGTYVVISDWERERGGTRKGAGLAFAAPT